MSDRVAEPESSPSKPLVVGVGASAGGLEALSSLVQALPVNAPLGVVVLQPLDAEHPSNLSELLGRRTAMKVVQATEGAMVEAGHIYVMAPSSDLRLSDGRLRLVPRPPAGHLPIDEFFESLARDCGPGAAGVVLSGTGTDGAMGLRALRGAGAITFAQDHTARHSDMPHAAIATGCVDHVLDPVEIAVRLLECAEDALVDAGIGGDAMERLFPLLQRASGTDFSSYKQATLYRRVQRRVALGHHASIDAYVDSLREGAPELEALAEDMLVHVTRFFRDPEVFAALSAQALPRLLAQKDPGDPFRVWVPGCSTGEEVYSLAILLSELHADAGRTGAIKIFGTDLSEKAIGHARVALYPESIEGQVSAERLLRFFVRTEAGYRVRKDLRDLCVFARHDITRDPPFSHIDLVSCRNLMIYLSRPMQRRVVPLFHYSLRTGGALLLGTSESPRAYPGFEALEAGQHLYQRKAMGPEPVAPSARSLPPPLRQLDVQREADRAVLTRHAPPGVVVTDKLVIVQFRGQTGPYLEPAPGTATLDLMRLAREELRGSLRIAIQRARLTGETIRTEVRNLRAGHDQRRIELEVIPLIPPVVPERHFIVLFREDAPEQTAGPAAPSRPGHEESVQRAVEEGLREELASTRDYLQAVIDQLEAGNEELQTTNEELQTAKEELQATNEELSTVNDEMVQRNAEGARINDDLTNVLNSGSLAILILGLDSRIRRFTPPAARLLNLIATDVGRPFTDLKSSLRTTEFNPLMRDVLAHLEPREQTITDEQGRWYQLTVRPYLTTDRKVDGTVVTLVDIDAVQRGQRLLSDARDYAEGIVDTVRQPLLVLDEHRRVRSANRSFYRRFGVTREQLEGKDAQVLGEPRWIEPEFSALLDRLEAGSTVDELHLEDTLTRFAGVSVLVSGRPLLRVGQPPWLLLAFEDLSEKMRADASVRRSERALRQMLGAASDSILIANANGRVTYANAMAARTFGYPPEELAGLLLEDLVPRVHEITAQKASVNRELHARRKGGSLFPAEVGLSTMESEQGPLVVAFVTDVSARREAEVRISAYKKNLQEMAFDAALVEERQRRRLAADLHDNVGQTLALAQIRLKALATSLSDGPAKELAEGIKLIARALEDTRALTFELSPPVLYDLGLPAALSWLGEQLEAEHLQVTVVAEKPFARLNDETAALLFRAVRELLTNVIKHARTTEASVSLSLRSSVLSVVVEDRGAGFDPARLEKSEAAQGFGLFSVREQMTRLGGDFEAVSSPGRGTKITLRVPFFERKSDASPGSQP